MHSSSWQDSIDAADWRRASALVGTVAWIAAEFGLQTPQVKGHSSLIHDADPPVQNLLQSAHCSQRPVTFLKVAMQALSAQVSEVGEHVSQVLRQ
mmetsp:Transcript_69417/g.215502  ORF Transcript_69417/g.215502 Transcript_69417/m.215502 type:complete len:95 (-) Transcript_69417:411-695(-)